MLIWQTARSTSGLLTVRSERQLDSPLAFLLTTAMVGLVRRRCQRPALLNQPSPLPLGAPASMPKGRLEQGVRPASLAMPQQRRGLGCRRVVDPKQPAGNPAIAFALLEQPQRALDLEVTCRRRSLHVNLSWLGVHLANAPDVVRLQEWSAMWPRQRGSHALPRRHDRSHLWPSAAPSRTSMPQHYSSSDDTHAMVARVAPAILELLGDGLPRSRHEVVAALALQHAKDEVVRTLMRLAVTGRLAEDKHKYRLGPPPQTCGSSG
jgi:hypothetical protein